MRRFDQGKIVEKSVSILINLSERVRPHLRPALQAFLKRGKPLPSDYSPHLLLLAILTPVYLAFELAFAADLLDVVGSAPSLAEIEDIERYGRFISGVAITLLAWSWLVLPAVRRFGLGLPLTVSMMSVSAVMSIVAAYEIQERLVHSVVERASPAERQSALLLSMATSAIRSGDIALAGIDLDAEMMNTPAGKAFIALLPALSVGVPDLLERSDAALEIMAARAALSGIAPVEEVFRKYQSESDAIRSDFEKVEGLLSALDERISSPDVDREVESAWSRYVADMKGRGMTVGAIPHQAWPRIREGFRSQGYAMPDDWSPNDGSGFRNLVRASILQKDVEAFDRDAKRLIGYPVPPVKDYAGFFEHPLSQLRLARAGIVSSGIVMSGLDIEGFRDGPYRSMAGAGVNVRIDAARADPESFGPSGEHEKIGETAAKVAWVPVVALLFSAVGALTHAVKSMKLFMKILPLANVNAKLKGWWVPGLAFGLLILPLALPNPVTSSRLYESLPGGNILFDWIIGAQGLIHPAGHAIGGIF